MTTRKAVIAGSISLILVLIYLAFPAWLLFGRARERLDLKRMASTITTDPVEIRNLDDHDPWQVALWPETMWHPLFSRLYGWLDYLPYEWNGRVVGLMLSDPRTTDDSLKYLNAMPYLQCVRVAGSQVTDAGVRRIAAHDRIWSVDFDDTSVTDESLKVLARMPSLQSLSIRGTPVSRQAVTEFRRARPDVEIDSDFGRHNN